MESSLQQSLFGHYEIFDKFKNLHLSKKFPNKIILSGEKGIGKCTLAYHLINYTLSLNEDYSYDTKNYKISLYVRGVELCGLGPTGMIFYITPTLQFLLGFFYYDEVFSFNKLVSFIFIWIAVIVYLKDLHENN